MTQWEDDNCVCEHADDDRRNPIQCVRRKPYRRCKAASTILSQIDAAEHTDRNGHRCGQSGQDQGADDRICHSATRLANRPRVVGKEIQIQRLDSLADDKKHDEGEWDERKGDTESTCHDEKRREHLAWRRGARAGHAWAPLGTRAAARGDACRAMDQINARDSMLTTSVMTNRTSPISMSAERYRALAASVNSLASTAAIVYCGANSDSDTCGLLPITIVTAIVSPSARPKPSITAPTMPLRA